MVMQLRELLQYERNSVQECLPDILKKFNPRVKITVCYFGTYCEGVVQVV
jgi:hypothetical protein